MPPTGACEGLGHRARDQRQQRHASGRRPPDPAIRPPAHRCPPRTSSPVIAGMYVAGESLLGHFFEKILGADINLAVDPAGPPRHAGAQSRTRGSAGRRLRRSAEAEDACRVGTLERIEYVRAGTSYPSRKMRAWRTNSSGYWKCAPWLAFGYRMSSASGRNCCRI
jgi:hypothetical protein